MTKEKSAGFLSKVAKFVRHPTTNWTELDQEMDSESRYSKQMLKDMIERRRRNDFVRKREFDMLRKLRQSGISSGSAEPGRPSFFQDSSQSRPDDRAQTLKKIDEIEAQMSQQWWRTKNPGSDGSSTDFKMSENPPIDSSDFGQETLPGDQADPGGPYATTQNTSSAGDGFAPTQIQGEAPEPAPAARREKKSAAARKEARSTSYSMSRIADMDMGEFVHDPEMEEAAIRFANGDDAGAEACLLDALSPGGARVAQQSVWMALFDLYRATSEQDRFESLAIDFANRFDRSAPAWFSMPEQVGRLEAAVANPVASQLVHWVCPSVLRMQSLAMLGGALARAAQPWCLDWRNLTRFDDNVAEPLLKVLKGWSESPVQLRFIGTGIFQAALASATPSGDRTVADIWWLLRMEALRVMHRPDEFELVALDYCVTFEVSPPSWENARCEYRAHDLDGQGGHQTIIGEPSMMESVQSSMDSLSALLDQDGSQRTLELSGLLMGDIDVALQTLDARIKDATDVNITCQNLIRVDFTAAGTLLNWAAVHQSHGKRIQLTELHSLIALFLTVIGVHEHAKLLVRTR